MKVRYGKEVANHSGPESCGDFREGVAEALTGETDRSAIEPRNQESGMPTLLFEAAWRQSQVMLRSRAVGDPEHVGKSLAQKLGDLIRDRGSRHGRGGEG